MLIKSKYPASPTVNNATWQFNLDRAGRHVCEVTDEKSIAMLLAVVDIYSEAEPLDPIEPIFQPEPERAPPAADPTISIETIGEAEFDRLSQPPATSTAIPAAAPIPASTDEPALSEAEATKLFAERQAERIRIEGAEAVARQEASLAASLAATAAGLGDRYGDGEQTAEGQALLDAQNASLDPTPNAHPLDHDGDGRPGGFVTDEQMHAIARPFAPAPIEPNPLDPNNEFPMDPGDGTPIGFDAQGGIVHAEPAPAPRDPLLDQPSAEDPNLTNAQVAARTRAAKKKQTKRSARKR